MIRSTEQPERLDIAAHAMADPTRRHLLRLVRDREVAAGELARRCPQISRPAVSQHLRILQRAELVTVRRAGNHRLYRSRPEGLGDLRAFIDEMWADRLSALKTAAERAETARRQTGRS